MTPKLQLFDYSAKTPSENIEIDTQLLQLSNDSIKENKEEYTAILRFWESQSDFVCLGASNKAETEVNNKETTEDRIPILKRCSGGGTVVQGPGCINYCIVLPLTYHKALKTIDTSNTFIMTQTQKAIQSLLPNSKKVCIQGYTDLTIDSVKFSGNAQRRLKHSLLFHGSILYDFDIQKISRYLAFPSRHPEYRKKRSHDEFCQNIPVTKEDIKKAIITQWTAYSNISTHKSLVTKLKQRRFDSTK